MKRWELPGFSRLPLDQMQRWLPPNKERATRVTGLVDPVGKIDSDGLVDLRQIRKPGFFGKGLWDRAESLEGTIAAYDRVRGLKEIVVVRGPHSMETWPPEELDRVRDRMTTFAVAAVQGCTSTSGASAWTNIKELVATTPNAWEVSSRPR